jgi:hypothetical protein
MALVRIYDIPDAEPTAFDGPLIFSVPSLRRSTSVPPASTAETRPRLLSASGRPLPRSDEPLTP